MNKIISFNKYQYKYKKKLEIQKANKNSKTKGELNKIKEASNPLKYSNGAFTNQKNEEKIKINLTKNIGNTDFKKNEKKNNYLNSYYNSIYKRQALFRNDYQNMKFNKGNTSINNNKSSIIKYSNIIDNINDKTEIKNNRINISEDNKVSEFTFKDKLSYSDKNKIRKNKYFDKNHKNNTDICFNIDSSFQIKSNSGNKSNLSYLNFIKDFNKKYNEDTNLKNKKKKNYILNLKKFVNKNNNNNYPNLELKINKEIILNFKSTLNKKDIKEKNENSQNDEIINIIKELEIKENKIKELSEKIIIQNNEYKLLNIKYTDILSENQKLKEEISNLKKEIEEIKEKQNIIPNVDIETNNNNKINKDSPKFNGLITYNINKNNNFNIINSEINNFNNIIQSND